MIFTAAPLQGVWVIDAELRTDERGTFFRSFCTDEFEQHQIHFSIVQSNVSSNPSLGTVRGMHFQTAPMEEAKVVNCSQGAIMDVIVDLRPDSSTWRKSFSIELSSRNRRSLYIPKGFAHGFQTLEENSDVLYLMSERYSPTHASGVRWNDPAFNVRWPLPISKIAEKDLLFGDYLK
ncbi:dTDP-4-dehydrorhamnose 3,5-epimerase [Bdellovibrionota bacterium FG-1]